MKACIIIEDLPNGGVDIKTIRSDLTPGDEKRLANRITTILENNLNELQSNMHVYGQDKALSAQEKAPLKRPSPGKPQARGDDETKALQAARGKKPCLH